MIKHAGRLDMDDLDLTEAVEIKSLEVSFHNFARI